MIEVGLTGLEVRGRHGVTDEERANPQRFAFDVSLVLASEDAGASDRLEDTVDYRYVVACVRDVCETREYRLLEALARAVADELRRRFDVREVTVSVHKPDLDLGVKGSADVTAKWP